MLLTELQTNILPIAICHTKRLSTQHLCKASNWSCTSALTAFIVHALKNSEKVSCTSRGII